jgi:hypothetical protein
MDWNGKIRHMPHGTWFAAQLDPEADGADAE